MAPNGRGYIVPLKKGVASPNPSGLAKDPQGTFHEVMSIARKNSAHAMRRMVELCDSNDERVAFIAAQAVIKRAWGEQPVNPNDGKQKSAFDLSRLSLPDLRALMTVMEAARVPESGDGPVVDAESHESHDG